ncbi:hypothetical protein [Nostoc sp.]|uniref:hypothetical protein n=1 Tax=Nostoc sp. TaxID=1180 RepID=UPI002FFD186C
MASRLFTPLITKEEANLSGGRKANGGRGGSANGGRGGDSNTNGGVVITGGVINKSYITGGTVIGGNGGSGGSGGSGGNGGNVKG